MHLYANVENNKNDIMANNKSIELFWAQIHFMDEEKKRVGET